MESLAARVLAGVVRCGTVARRRARARHRRAPADGGATRIGRADRLRPRLVRAARAAQRHRGPRDRPRRQRSPATNERDAPSLTVAPQCGQHRANPAHRAGCGGDPREDGQGEKSWRRDGGFADGGAHRAGGRRGDDRARAGGRRAAGRRAMLQGGCSETRQLCQHW